ncbi:MAG: hypothetical protein ACRD3C_00855 [Vicinamibacterales bacterium]
MDQLEQLQGDLHFVRAAVETADRDGSPAMIYFLWAVVILCGFALVDFRQTWVPWYWSIAGPAGFLASAYVGWRHARRTGQMAASPGSRYLLHWGGMLAAIFLAVLMPMSGLLQWDGLGPAILLILALGYFQAGVHLDRPFLWIGLLMGVGYVLVMFVSAYTWTVLGLVLAAGLTIAGLRGGHPHEATA